MLSLWERRAEEVTNCREDWGDGSRADGSGEILMEVDTVVWVVGEGEGKRGAKTQTESGSPLGVTPTTRRL
jgi:hypothetical protein